MKKTSVSLASAGVLAATMGALASKAEKDAATPPPPAIDLTGAPQTERPPITEADSLADLNGTPRPDNPSPEATALQAAEQLVGTEVSGRSIADRYDTRTIGDDTEVVALRVPTDVAVAVADLTQEQLQAVLEEGTTLIGVDMAAGPDHTATVFVIDRLDVAHRLPVVASHVETHPANIAAGSITVFKSPTGENMELVLVDPFVVLDEAHEPGAIFMTDHDGNVLVAQPFKQQEHA